MILDRSIFWLATCQMLAAVAFLLPAWLLGGCAAWVPALGTLIASFAVHLWWGMREPRWLDRARVRRNALGSGILHAPLFAAGYTLLWVTQPAWFGFGWEGVASLAPILGLGGGALAMALTLAGGDAAAAAVGTSLDVPIDRHTLVTETPRAQWKEDEESD